MKKAKYETPNVEIMEFESDDIITSSPGSWDDELWADDEDL